MNPLTAAAIATVEWALVERQRWNICQMCACSIYIPPPDSAIQQAIHSPDCPIPALGAAIMRERDWYGTHFWTMRDIEDSKNWQGDLHCWTGISGEDVPYCTFPRGHDNGIHEPTQEELNAVNG